MRFTLDEVESYLQNKLKLRLLDYGVSESFSSLILSSIETRVYSLISMWNDEPARNAVLVVGMEEGLFYRPNANHAIRFFVVVAIRNSLLETICSNDSHEAGLATHLGDDQIKQITQDAIIHFGMLDFSDLCKRMDGVHQYTYFADVLSKYPVATEALKRIGLMDGKALSYPKVAALPLSIPEMDSATNHQLKAVNKVVLSGISDEIDSALLDFLRKAGAGALPFFFTYCFKTLTRNFDKLMRITEYVLTRNTPFVTNNYYIENGYIQKRQELIRAPHSAYAEDISTIRYPGAGTKHSWALNMLLEDVTRYCSAQN